FGNAVKKEILAHANVKDAKNVIVAIDNPKKLYHICQTLQKYVSNNKIIVKVHRESEKSSIESLGIKNIIVENLVTSKIIFDKIVG
ncbi:MAG: NAD-binding protein, partial [Campylobacterota bacterium]|nr:NAD-binding protein [Campylobacterota bacterium]